jgi:CubicO group peptidase (beta-lactamase class C family)
MIADPSAMGFWPGGLAKLDDVIQRDYIDAGKIPGAVIVLARHGKVVRCSALGWADLEHGTPMQEDTIFRLYSMTKPITSVAFMTLVERKSIALSDPVFTVIPEWSGLVANELHCPTPFYRRRPMLIIDLLRHTSGLAYGLVPLGELDPGCRKNRLGNGSATLDEMIRLLARKPLEFWPGEAWNYSVATDVLGYLIEKLTRTPLDQFLRERIFGPLDMRDTDFHAVGKGDRLAACYATPPALTLLDDPFTSAYLHRPTLCSGGGGLVSTARDYMRFCQMLLSGGSLDGVQILQPETIATMTRNHLPGGRDLPSTSRAMFTDASYRGVGFGLGFAVTIDSGVAALASSAGDYSWGGGASTYFWIDPREDLIGIFMTQIAPSSALPLRRDVRTLVYSAICDRVPR